MKNSKLFIYNHGLIELANYGKNSHECFCAVLRGNDELIRQFNTLPENIFYFMVNHRGNVICTYTGRDNIKELSQERLAAVSIFNKKQATS